MTLSAGSPPRVRGEGSERRASVGACRITPACAGRSRWRPICCPVCPDHPRVCGEKQLTSTYPERDHPRVCGEKPHTRREAFSFGGSPPRVRGEDRLDRPQRGIDRITPACAGRSMSAPFARKYRKDHPRVCGEKAVNRPFRRFPEGSPPRVRGEVRARLAAGCLDLDHPRVCGEKSFARRRPSWTRGSPPRVRGEGLYGDRRGADVGITPACAGRRTQSAPSHSII